MLLLVELLGRPVLWAEADRQVRRPVPRGTAPEVGVAHLGCRIEPVPFGKKRQVTPRVPLRRRHEAAGAILVVVVLPRHNGRHQRRNGGEIGKCASRDIRGGT